MVLSFLFSEIPRQKGLDAGLYLQTSGWTEEMKGNAKQARTPSVRLG